LIIRLVDTCNCTAHNRQHIIDLGAKLYEDHRTADGLGWVTSSILRETNSASSKSERAAMN
jgi:hypothetical protein